MARFWCMSPEEFGGMTLERICQYAEMTNKIHAEECE
nr:MAG TPA: hypothetical protein [Caudoviricetes sp.]DAL41122.1 MAG TPA_asm: hypothetical protein [Caudoviricetes sp.]